MTVRLFNMLNYHWYLKQEIFLSDSARPCLFWLPDTLLGSCTNKILGTHWSGASAVLLIADCDRRKVGLRQHSLDLETVDKRLNKSDFTVGDSKATAEAHTEAGILRIWGFKSVLDRLGLIWEQIPLPKYLEEHGNTISCRKAIWPALVAVIDGANLGLTDFSSTVLPPPLSSIQITFLNDINELTTVIRSVWLPGPLLQKAQLFTESDPLTSDVETTSITESIQLPMIVQTISTVFTGSIIPDQISQLKYQQRQRLFWFHLSVNCPVALASTAPPLLGLAGSLVCVKHQTGSLNIWPSRVWHVE
ncbi:unnamed protein product [Protopolystoma xenopodis]|uniref:ELP1 N-terminal second beta-propeller domain-containing protein n=1 Tax=Protopolystoma xenopodis TaxID=117903 RepID=A0A448XL00_9PLAT|nr:unnamed protein product [Protopolystoma xenopodis]